MVNAFSGVDLKLKDGRVVDAGEHVKGKLVVLYFSASWCAPCREFTPIMKELYRQIGDQPIEVILISKDYMRFQLDEYYEQHGCSWGVVPLRHPFITHCFDKYNVKDLPSCRVVNEHGDCLVQDARAQVESYTRQNRELTSLFQQWRQISV